MKKLAYLKEIAPGVKKVKAVVSIPNGVTPPSNLVEIPENGTPLLGASWVESNGRSLRAATVRGFKGLGDTFYARPVIKKMLEREDRIYLHTSWPQFFWDLDRIFPVRPERHLRTQNANVDSCDASVWNEHIPGLKEYRYQYSFEDHRMGRTPIDKFMLDLDVSGPIDFSMPCNPKWIKDWIRRIPKPFGIVHPPSIRREWSCPSRDPKTEYIQEIMDLRKDIHWISVAWLKEGEEWFSGNPLKGVYKEFNHGELPITELLGLAACADVVLSGPCYLLPMGAALGTPTFTVFGGSMAPDLIADKRMGPHVGYVAPEPFCRCLMSDHACNKEIERDRLLWAFSNFMNRSQRKTA